MIKKVKNTVPWTFVIYDENDDEIIETFYEKKLQKTNQQEFRIEEVIKKKSNKYFPKLYEPFVGDINVKVNLPNYATKTDIKNIWHINTSSFAFALLVRLL